MKIVQSKHRLKNLLIGIFIAGSVVAFGQKAEKVIEKSYQVNKDFTLGIENEYGEINIVNWEKNEVSVLVRIETEASSQAKAEALLKEVEIDISESSSEVFFETEIDGSEMRGKKKIRVIYDVKAPASINASLEQRYGNIYIQEIAGEVNLEMHYGNLTADALSLSETDRWNSLELAYGSAQIGYVTALSAEIKYSEFQVDESKVLSIESAYSKLNFGVLNDIDLESKYDKLIADQLTGYFDIESAYTQIKINTISRDFSGIAAEMKYGNLKGGLEANTSFEIDADVTYGSVIIPDGNYKFEKQAMNTEVHGTIGTQAKAEVIADIKYGSLELK